MKPGHLAAVGASAKITVEISPNVHRRPTFNPLRFAIAVPAGRAGGLGNAGIEPIRAPLGSSTAIRFAISATASHRIYRDGTSLNALYRLNAFSIKCFLACISHRHDAVTARGD